MDIVGLLLDVGPSMGFTDQDGNSCLEKSKNILSMLVQRKIFSESDDKVCLFTYGSTGTANELASGNNYEHISMERDLRKADWGLCSHIQNTIQATDHEVDFMDALIVTSTYLINQINSINDKKEKKKISEGRRLIMVFSNLDNPVATDVAEMKDIIEGFKDNKIEIHFIGPNLSSAAVEDDNQPGPSTGASNSSNGGHSKAKTDNQIKCESIAQEIIQTLDGCAYDFREALAAVSVFENKQKNSTAWSPDLIIGEKLRIPISGYKMVSRESLPSFKKCSARNPDEDITKKFDTFLPDGTNTEVDKEDIIKGYRYGTDLVPFTDDDMANMKFKCDVREFSVIGFTKSSNIKRHYFAGKDTMMIAAKKNNEEAAVALSALCTALKETETVGIVRKVYSARSSPTIGALIPVTDAEVEYLVFIELPFIEDMRELEFPSLAVEPSTSSKSAPSQQQLDAVDSLIDAMDMSAQPEDDDSVVPCKMKNPTLQRLYQVLAARALDDTCHIPELSPMISNIVNSTAYSCRWIDRDQEEFSKLFTLETAAKTAKKNNDNVYKDSGVAPSKVDEKGDGAGFDSTNLRDLNQEEITEIGTIDPARDFDQMLRSPKLAIKAYTGMTERILQFITETVGSSLYEKALRCIKKLRAAAVKSNDQELLEIVNYFFSSMKSLLLNKGPKDFWAELIEEKITPIDKDEASNSDVSAADKNSYLSEIEKVSAPAEPEPMEDADDMLDMI